METKYHNLFLILIIAVAVRSLHASSGQPQSTYNDQEPSLEKCLKHLDILQAEFGLKSSRKISTNEDCSDTIQTILSNIPSPMHYSPQMIFGSRSDDGSGYSKENRFPAVDEGNGQNGRSVGKNAALGGQDDELYSKYAYPINKKNISGKLASIKNTLFKYLGNPDDVSTRDISNRPDNLNFVDQRALISSLKHGENLISRLKYLQARPKTYNDIPKEDFENDDQTGSAVSDDEVSWVDKAPSAKRTSGNWLNGWRTDVAKRRRPNLSINNALMALSDMVMEHGREKLMRNRDNLRYHMFVQG